MDAENAQFQPFSSGWAGRLRKVARWLRGGEEPTYWCTRVAILRLLGLVYFFAFFSATQQIVALIGEEGLLPAKLFAQRLEANYGADWFWDLPSIFWFSTSDDFLLTVCWVGVGLSALLTAGIGNGITLAILWALYLSLNQVGQLFYGYGWEIQLAETGFLAIWLAPGWRLGWLHKAAPPPTAVIWLYRWLIFRIMLGAGLIKLRGDACWVDLTCLQYHYETQPIPNPLSWVLHQMPDGFHTVGILFNHFVELVAAWFAFGPRRIRHLAGLALCGFQISLILSGNLSFLNWLTLIPCLACFDDSWLKFFFGRRTRERWRDMVESEAPRTGWILPSRARTICVYAVVLLVATLSVDPVLNMVSPGQAMNRSFGRLRLVNTYGAFGSVGQKRDEVILQGTHDDPADPNARWVEYEFACKPGSVDRRPCVLGPYHHRLDWQIWFSAMSNINREPWLVHLVYKLLKGDEKTLALLDHNPFEGRPPSFIRAERYEYRFSSWEDADGNWWKRQRLGQYLRPMAADDPQLVDFLRRRGWLAD